MILNPGSVMKEAADRADSRRGPPPLLQHPPNLPRPRHPPPGAGKERREPADGLGILVLLPDGIRIFAASPRAESDHVSWSIHIEQNVMRDITVEAPHVRPNLTREVKPF